MTELMDKHLNFATCLVCALLIVFTQGSSAKIACKNPAGEEVDWWVTLKGPGTSKRGNTDYAYIDSTSTIQNGSYTWVSGKNINKNQDDNPLASTLSPIYDMTREDVGYVIWNDEEPTSSCTKKDCTSFTLAHSKGVLAFSSDEGFLISHSYPKFPDNPSKSKYNGIALGQTLNGQHAICISLNYEGVDKAAELFSVTKPFSYGSKKLSDDVMKRYPKVLSLISKPYNRTSPPPKTTVTLQNKYIASVGNKTLTSFSKSPTTKKGLPVRLWEDLVVKNLHGGFNIQTWPEGAGKDFPSYCVNDTIPYSTFNILEIKINELGMDWDTRHKKYHDHSKWAVSFMDSENLPFVCFGDLNRAVHQSYRGGAALCFQDDPYLHASVSKIIKSTEACDSSAKPTT